MKSVVGGLVAPALLVLFHPAQAGGIPHLFREIFDFISDFKDTASQLNEGFDLAGKLNLDDEDHLSAVELRAERFHAPDPTVEKPKIAGDDLFSSDSSRRQGAKDTWDTYVDAQGKALDRLQKTRDSKAEQLNQYRAEMKLAEQTRDLFNKIGQTPASPQQYDFAKKGVAMEPIISGYGKVIQEYDRIIKEYDTNIDKLKIQYNNDQYVQGIFDKALKDWPSQQQAQVPDKQSPANTSPSSASTVVERRIGNAMVEGGSDYQHQAKQEIQSLRDKHTVVEQQNEVRASQDSPNEPIGEEPEKPPTGPAHVPGGGGSSDKPQQQLQYDVPRSP